MQKLHRIPWIDILRGIAITIMIPANLSTLWIEAHPMWFRIVASYAAPIFIMLSTGMVILTRNQHGFSYFLNRGLTIIGFAVLIDIVVWKIFPFVTYDVLYLIGISIPIIYLMRHLNNMKLFVVGAFIIVLTPLLQHFIGYHLEISEINWANKYWPSLARLLQAWLIDGWFPVFPWLGLALLGAIVFRLIVKQNATINNKMILSGIILAVFGFVLLFVPTDLFNNVTNNGILKERLGFSEIFYPPTIPYLISAIGMVIIFSWLSEYLTKFSFSKILAMFGRYSLMIYLLHQMINVFVITPILQVKNMEGFTSGFSFFLIVIATFIIVYLFCHLMELLKKVYTPAWLPLKMLLGK